MTITQTVWEEYIAGLRKINETASSLVEKYYEEKIAIWNAYGSGVITPKRMEEFIDYCYAVVTKYGEAASELTAEMYDAVAATEPARFVEEAVPAPTATRSEVESAMRSAMEETNSPSAIGSIAGRAVKQAGIDTTMQNAARDGAEFAWIPHGETCAFCLMLASNGWQLASKKALKGGHAGHVHANCDCTYAIRFSEDTKYAGYNPDEYRQMYDSAEGRSWKQKLNSMRRDLYDRNKDVINEQKREAYAERVEREDDNSG